jgi:hypothetical protein
VCSNSRKERHNHSAFFAAALATVAAFALFGPFTSLTPGFIAGTSVTTHTRAHRIAQALDGGCCKNIGSPSAQGMR